MMKVPENPKSEVINTKLISEKIMRKKWKNSYEQTEENSKKVNIEVNLTTEVVKVAKVKEKLVVR